jgi:hypothetical protein
MEDKLKDILETDYGLILMSGEYGDCPCCDPVACLTPKYFFTEESLLKEILKHTNVDRMESIWLVDSYGKGDMIEYSHIETVLGFHNVTSLKFNLPKAGRIVIYKEKGVWKVADKAYLILYDKDLK